MEFTAITMFPVSAVCLDEPSDCTIVTGVVIVELLPGHSFSPLGDTTLPKPGGGRRDQRRECGHRSEIHRALMYSVASLGDVIATGPDVNQPAHPHISLFSLSLGRLLSLSAVGLFSF